MNPLHSPNNRRLLVVGAVGLSLIALAGTLIAKAAQPDFASTERPHFWPGNLVVSRSVYDNRAANVDVGAILPPNCAATQAGCSGPTGATNNGAYPYVWNNVLYDASFGITSKIYLDQMTPGGWLLDSLEVPNDLDPGAGARGDRLVTSFSSKSEMALSLSTSGDSLSFMGYVAPVNAIDVSNSNTPAAPDPTNPVGQAFYRAVASVDRFGSFHFTETNAYSGNNGRAAILNNEDGASDFYTAGNAGNGANPQPAGVILGAGAQFIRALEMPEGAQNPALPTPLASFSVTELGDKADKLGKDDNFRGLTVFNHVVYFSKGSGSNGVNTVYFIDTTGTACPNGIGLPAPSAALPTAPLSYNAGQLATSGLPNNMCILAGFPSVSTKTAATVSYPFGVWFADANTLYVADEGDGFASDDTLYSHAAAQTTAGLQKWIFDATTGAWNLAYTLQQGLELGQPYTVRGYPTGNNAGPGGTGLPWAPATDGLRNIAGRVNPDGTVTVWAITSTVSGNGDTGADPNRLVAITDRLRSTDADAALHEGFVTLRTAAFAEVLRGVSFTPGTPAPGANHNDNGRGW